MILNLKLFHLSKIKDENYLDDQNKKYSSCFRKKVYQKYVIDFIINTNYELKATYHYYQEILKFIDKRDKNIFLFIINNKNNNISPHAKKDNKPLMI